VAWYQLGHMQICSLQIKLPTTTMLAAVQADHGQPHLSVFQYIAVVDFVQRFV